MYTGMGAIYADTRRKVPGTGAYFSQSGQAIHSGAAGLGHHGGTLMAYQDGSLGQGPLRSFQDGSLGNCGCSGGVSGGMLRAYQDGSLGAGPLRSFQDGSLGALTEDQKKYAMYGGAALLGALVLFMLFKK